MFMTTITTQAEGLSAVCLTLLHVFQRDSETLHMEVLFSNWHFFKARSCPSVNIVSHANVSLCTNDVKLLNSVKRDTGD